MIASKKEKLICLIFCAFLCINAAFGEGYTIKVTNNTDYYVWIREMEQANSSDGSGRRVVNPDPFQAIPPRSAEKTLKETHYVSGMFGKNDQSEAAVYLGEKDNLNEAKKNGRHQIRLYQKEVTTKRDFPFQITFKDKVINFNVKVIPTQGEHEGFTKNSPGKGRGLIKTTYHPSDFTISDFTIIISQK